MKRNSSIELLKIMAIVMIVISHAIPVGMIDLGLATDSLQYNIIRFIKCFGQIGNNIFIVSSAWFLLESEKAHIKKIWHMIGMCFVISIIMLLCFLLLDYPLPWKFCVKQFFPVTFGNLWFLTCYLLYYLIHPALNLVIKRVDKRQLLLIDSVLVILYCIMSYAMEGHLFYYNELVGFTVIHFIVAYVKKYLSNTISSQKFNVTVLGVGIIGWFAIYIIANVLGLHVNFFYDQVMRWNRLMNPCYILIAMGLFCIFNNHTFYRNAINYCSSLSLLVYMIHGNQIIMNYIRYDIWEEIINRYTDKNLILWVLLYGVVSLVGAFILAFVYDKMLNKHINKLVDGVVGFLSRIYRRWENIMIKWD